MDLRSPEAQAKRAGALQSGQESESLHRGVLSDEEQGGGLQERAPDC